MAVFVHGGCAYYNTFYNIKKDFKAAERQQQKVLATGEATMPPRPGQPNQSSSSAQVYQNILQSCAKLLEYYPNSRWIDDALMIMGICYYRSDEFARAERKFTELLTIFPTSKHTEDALVWKARSLFAQEQLDVAEEFLSTAEVKLKSPDAIAATYRIRARISEKRERPEEAISFLERIRDISYDRSDKASDFLSLGKSYEKLSRNSEAKSALLRCLDLTRDPSEVFEARRLLAQMESQEGNYQKARALLRPLQTDRRFLERAGDVQVELARVEAVSGSPDLCIQMLELYCSTAPQGESKARAYYLQGEVARDRLGHYEIAQAKFDSVAGAGASRSLQDSARIMSRQLQQGLTALSVIPELENNLRSLLQEPQEAKTSDSAEARDSNASAGLNETKTSDTEVLNRGAEQVSTADTMVSISSADTNSQSREVTTNDSTDSLRPDTEFIPESRIDSNLSPAELVTDSIMRALSQNDSLRRSLTEEIKDDSVPKAEQEKADSNDTNVLRERIASISVQLVAAHLDAASFYELVVNQPDSALEHTKRAVAVPDSSYEHWRASMQLGLELERRDPSDQGALVQFQRIAAAEAAPTSIRNAARARLGLPELAVEKSDQELALELAEKKFLTDSVDSNELLMLYRAALAYDSTSASGIKSLQAIAYIQEYLQAEYDSALHTHLAIGRLFPDSTFSEVSILKTQEPDSNSIFMMTDEDLQATLAPVIDVLSTSSDSTGWPPEESSLRGRRFH